MVVQFFEYIKNHWIAYFKGVNFMACVPIFKKRFNGLPKEIQTLQAHMVGLSFHFKVQVSKSQFYFRFSYDQPLYYR